MKINIVKKVIDSNSIVAEENRSIFKKAKVLALNLISSPGSGKTTLLEKTIPALGKNKSVVMVGDLETSRDADRLAPFARQSTQINTGMSCHLYANQIHESLKNSNLKGVHYVFIENVGNMVCPGEVDLGENLKVVMLSIPEGDDKVAKYPTIFKAADIVLLSKYELLEHLKFDVKRVKEDIKKINSKLNVIPFSAFTGLGMKEWIEWLSSKLKESIGAQAKYVPEN